MSHSYSHIIFAFFGTDEFSIGVLEELKAAGFLPSLIITAPDRPRGKKLRLTPPPVKVWAQQEGVPTLQPEKLDDDFIQTVTEHTPQVSFDVFVVASYGIIIPKSVIELPDKGTLNVHPSLLPHLRGASPVQTAILEEDETGVTIMDMDEKMDHGPIVAQEKAAASPWPTRSDRLEQKLARAGGKLLAKVLPDWINGIIKETPQDHSKASFTKKITKADGELDLNDNPEKNYRKIQAFYGWPGTYFFTENKKGKTLRVIIKKARLQNGELIIERVLPEGKKEMDYQDFLKGLN